MPTTANIPACDPKDLPNCHAEGEKPEGYDAGDDMCRGCIDKFTCLPAAERNPKIWTVRGARVWKVSDDADVEAVLGGALSYDDAIARMMERQQYIDDDEEVPEELALPRPSPGTPPSKKSAPQAQTKDQVSQHSPADTKEEEEPEVAKKSKPKKAAKAKAKKSSPPRAAKKKVSKPPPKKAAKARVTKALKRAAKSKAKPASRPPRRPRLSAAEPSTPPPAEKRQSVAPPAAAAKRHSSVPPAPLPHKHPIARNGKPLPLPKQISEEQMIESMQRIKLGKPIEFEVGMTIVRKTKDGEHTVLLTKTGYLYSGDAAVYPSLSGVAQVASGTPNRSGNDYYNLVTSRATSVVSAKGKVIADYNS